MKLACGMKDCTHRARWTICLKMWAPKFYGPHPPMKAYLSMGVCDFHKDTLEVDDVLGDEGYNQIAEALIKMRRPAPDRNRTQIEYIFIESTREGADG